MCEEEHAMFPGEDRAAKQLLQPKEGTEQAGVAIGMSR